MAGNELAARLLTRRPDTQVLFMSGYGGDHLDGPGAPASGATVLAKPFTMNQLLAAVRNLLAVARP
jgi:DNA-binding response OmpR family regulator